MSFQDHEPSAAAASLLAALQSGAEARRVTAAGDLRLSRRHRRRGISLSAGTAPAAAGRELLEAGLARWDGDLLVLAAPAPGDRRVLAPVRLPGEATAVAVNLRESPLAWLYRRRDASGQGFIDERCFLAGERLRAELTAASMLPRMGVDWSQVPAGTAAPGALLPGEAQSAARQRVRAALAAAGPELAGTLIDVCGHLKPLEQVERERQWPQRSAKLVLRLGLQALARHYRIEVEARGPKRARTRAWRQPAEDPAPPEGG
jgi:hypothetical protein